MAPTLASLRGWYESDLGVTLVGSDVDAWADQSGVGNHLVAPAAGNRPLYIASSAAFGNRPAIEFDGVGERLHRVVFSHGGDTSLWSMFMVYQQVSYTSGDCIAVYLAGGNNRPALRQPPTANTVAWLPAGGATESISTTTFNDGIARLVGGTWNSSSGVLYVNGAQEDSDVNAGADFADGANFTLGGAGAAAPANFRISLLTIQRAVTSAAEIAALIAYARAKYGVP